MLGSKISNQTLAKANWKYISSPKMLIASFDNFGARQHCFDDIKELLERDGGNSKLMEKSTARNYNSFAVKGDENVGIVAHWARKNNPRVHQKLRDARLPEHYFEPPQTEQPQPLPEAEQPHPQMAPQAPAPIEQPQAQPAERESHVTANPPAEPVDSSKTAGGTPSGEMEPPQWAKQMRHQLPLFPDGQSGRSK